MSTYSFDLFMMVSFLFFFPIILQIGIVVQEIFPEGAVHRDKRLKPGDLIVQVSRLPPVFLLSYSSSFAALYI